MSYSIIGKYNGKRVCFPVNYKSIDECLDLIKSFQLERTKTPYISNEKFQKYCYFALNDIEKQLQSDFVPSSELKKMWRDKLVRNIYVWCSSISCLEKMGAIKVDDMNGIEIVKTK